MPSRVATFGLLILVAGFVTAAVGAATPAASATKQPVTLVSTPVIVGPNDYASQSLALSAGQPLHVGLSIDNMTIFTFDIMNQTQYAVWYGCAPRCHQPLLGGTGTFYQQAKERTPTLLNATVSPSAPLSAQFTAPSNATYYFVLDSSVGPTWSAYLGQNASGYTTGNLTLTTVLWVTGYAVNWPLVGLGSVVTLAGGAVATWWPRPRVQR